MAKVISIINQKGGVCKTSTSLCLGVGLSKKSIKTLLIDLDGQASLTQFLNISSPQHDIYEFLNNTNDYKPCEINEYLHILPSSIDFLAYEAEITSETGREFLIKEAIDKIKFDYDYIIIDCSPTLGLTTINALVASNTYLIPVLPEPSSIQGFKTLNQIVDKIQSRLNESLYLEGVLLTKMERHLKIHQSVEASFRDFLKDKIYSTSIRKNVSMIEATNFGQSIFEYAPNSNAAIDYGAFVNEFINKQ
jgi:chromosome partitioning protein